MEKAEESYTSLSQNYAWIATRILGIKGLLLKINQKNTEIQPAAGQS
jgi:hypothetical protein